jgi:hypothetical protein
MSSDFDPWEEFLKETNANHQMAQNHQKMFEQSIGNIAAVKLLNDQALDEAVKNS